MLGASCFGAAFAWAPNFREGLNAAGRIITSLAKQSTIVDPDTPAVDNFVSIILISLDSQTNLNLRSSNTFVNSKKRRQIILKLSS